MNAHWQLKTDAHGYRTWYLSFGGLDARVEEWDSQHGMAYRGRVPPKNPRFAAQVGQRAIFFSVLPGQSANFPTPESAAAACEAKLLEIAQAINDKLKS